MTITFTGKIPIAKCQIKNRLTQKRVPATFFEYDCRDIEDSIEVKTAKRMYSL